MPRKPIPPPEEWVRIVELMGRDMTGGQRHLDPSDDPRRLMQDAHKLTGTWKAAAALLGVAASTLYRWRTKPELKPKLDTAGVVQRLRRRAFPAGREARIRNGTERLMISVEVGADSPGKGTVDVRSRKLKVGDHIPLTKIRNIIGAWQDGNDQRAARLLHAAVEKHYWEGIAVERVIGAWFE